MPRHPALSLILTLTVLGGTTAQAGQIVLRPLAPGLVGEYSNLGPSGENHQQVADVFVLAQASTLESLTWYGRYDAPYSTAGPIGFEVRIFSDSGGSPAIMPSWVKNDAANAYEAGTNYLGVPWLTYTMALPGWSLGAGTYWLSIVEDHDPTLPYGDRQWLWGDTAGSGFRAIRGQDNTAWAAGLDTNHAFTLEGTVPDPGSTLLLLGMGLVGLRAWRRRGQ
jgi:hypothetical protein